MSLNKTIKLTAEQQQYYADKCWTSKMMVDNQGEFDTPHIPVVQEVDGVDCLEYIKNPFLFDHTVNDDLFKVLPLLPVYLFDLIVVDPPYNLTKDYGDVVFKNMEGDKYSDYVMSWLPSLVRLLKPTGTIYICSDWKSSPYIYQCISQCDLVLRNRITWKRQKGRAAKDNFKNCHEDIWYCTKSKKFVFNANSIGVLKRQIAPYKDPETGEARDWFESETGGKYRVTSPSNLIDDVVIPFWSMSENTTHITQKPEKLIAKLVLASSNEGDFVFDPFLGSGTTSVVAKKLNRHYFGVERDNYFAAVAERRLEMVDNNNTIQGYNGKFFTDCNLKDERAFK